MTHMQNSTFDLNNLNIHTHRTSESLQLDFVFKLEMFVDYPSGWFRLSG